MRLGRRARPELYGELLRLGDTGFHLAHARSKVLEVVIPPPSAIHYYLACRRRLGWAWDFFLVWRPHLPACGRRVSLRSTVRVSKNTGLRTIRRALHAAHDGRGPAVYTIDSRVIDGAVNGSAWLTRTLSRVTGGSDRYIVDGLVNAIAIFISRLMSPLFRAAQTGLTANYALVMVIGLVAAVALFFGGDFVASFRR